MAGKDKTTRVFLHGAWRGVLGLAGIWGLAWLLKGEVSLYFPLRVENLLSFAPWMLAGGLIGLASHFYKERRIQFSILVLLLITTLFSLSAAALSLAHSRCRGEKQALAALEERLGRKHYIAIDTGFLYYQKIVGIGLNAKAIDSDEIPFLMSQLEYFPCLRKVVFSGEERFSESDFATLKAKFPNIDFACKR